MTAPGESGGSSSETRARRPYWIRRLIRNAAILLASSALAAAVFVLARDKSSAAYQWSMATGYASVALLGLALALGPWWLLRGRPMPVSTDVRRDVGLWGAAFAVAHVLTGLEVHAGGRWSRYFFWWPLDGHTQPLRLDAFGLANWTGLVATVLLLVLAIISNDVSLRALGTARWKSLQRWTYVAAGLVVLHGIAYQLIDGRALPFVAAFAAISLLVAALQLLGRRIWRGRRG